MCSMTKPIVVVQASSRSWSGGNDLCMNLMDSSPVISHTINALKTRYQNIIIAAPEFDQGGLDFLKGSDNSLIIHYGQDESPLSRIVAATSHLSGDEYILRLNALNFCVDLDAADEMYSLSVTEQLDMVRFPENFPSLFTSDIYKISILRQLLTLNLDSKYHVHPKYYLSESNGFRSAIYTPPSYRYTDELLKTVRNACSSSIYQSRIEVDLLKSVKSADSIRHHYEMTIPYLDKSFQVLDLACGSGFGADLLSGSVSKVTGIDIDGRQLGKFKSNNPGNNIEFIVADVLCTGFPDALYDCITAFEIIEHVDPDVLLKEIFRLLKPGGLCFISTPQNVLGHIPSTPDHVREFSLSELLDVVSKYFKIEKVIGIKQGVIYFENDPLGSNTFLLAYKL